jgi:hypothetical protein
MFAERIARKQFEEEGAGYLPFTAAEGTRNKQLFIIIKTTPIAKGVRPVKFVRKGI